MQRLILHFAVDWTRLLPSKMKTALLKVAAIFSALLLSTSALGIPDPEDGHRASIVQASSMLIRNVNRTYSVGDQTFVLNPGPEVSTEWMLYFEHLVKQATALTATTNFNASKVQTFLEERLPFGDAEDFHQAYKDLAHTGMMPAPLALDSSDENFGAMRLSILGNNLKLVHGGEYAEYLWDIRFLCFKTYAESRRWQVL